MPAVSPTPIVAYSGSLPDPSDRATYGARGRALWDWEVNTLLPGVNLHSVAAFENAQFAETMALVSAAAANFKGPWSSLTGALAMPASASHTGNFYALTANVADVTAHTPGVSSAWILVNYSSSQITHGAGTVYSKFTSVDAEILAHETLLNAVVDSGLGGHRNRLMNGDWSQNVRALTSVADDTYFLDRWYVLTETGNVTVAQLTDAESGAPFGVRVTQPDASPKRMGFAQIIESKNIRQYASRAMNLAARLRLSTGANIRYAVIEHTGTADVVTSDVVNSWASATFTPSNFFIGGVNIISTGVITPGAATWGEVSDWDALGASVKNVIVFVWTEAQVAQNVTLDCSRIQYEPGVVATPHDWRMSEDVLCARYAYPLGTSRPKGQAASASSVTSVEVYTPAPMRSTPAITSASHNFTAAGGSQVGPFTVTVTSMTGNAVRLDGSGGSGLVAGNATVLVPAAGTLLVAEL